MKRTLSVLILSGICHFSAIAQTDGYIVENFRVEDGLSSNNTYALTYDRNGYLWIGCQGFINRYDGNEFKEYDLNSTNNVTKIIQNEDGMIFAKCDDAALYLDKASDCFKPYGGVGIFDCDSCAISGVPAEIKNTKIGKWIFGGIKEKAIVYDTEKDIIHYKDWTSIRGAIRNSDGKIWLATNNGIYVVDDELNVLSHISKNKEERYALHDNALNDIAIDRFGGIWVSSYFEGIFHFSPNDGEICRHSDIPGGVNTRVRNIVEDSEGYLWLGTEDNGLFRYDRQQHIYKKVSLPSMSNNIVNLQYIRDTLWVRTYEPEERYIGLHLQTGNVNITSTTPDDYEKYDLCLLNESIFLPDYGKFFACVTDGEGNRWISGSKGLLCVNADSTSNHLFTKRDGLQFNNFNYASLLYASDSLIYAGTTEGFISFNPQKMLTVADSVTIKVSGIEHKNGTIRIKNKDNSLNINAVTLDFRTPRRSWLQYRVSGLTNEWKDVREGHIILSNLKQGKYKLQIRALTGNGDTVLEEWEQEFRILPPPYLSVWALIAYLLLAFAIIYISVKVTSRNAIMDSKVALARRLAGEIRRPMALAQIQMETLLDKFNRNPDAQAQKELKGMRENLESINLMIDHMTELRSAESVNLLTAEVKEDEEKISLPNINSFDATILIITPSEEMFRFFNNILTDNFNLLRARGEADALPLLETKYVSLIIIDNVTETDEGIDLCRKIKQLERTAHKQVVIISTNYNINSRVLALSSGADVYLAKPLSHSILLATISNLLTNRAAIRKYYSEHPAINAVKLENTSPDNILMRKIHDFIIKNLSNENLRVNDIALANHVSLSKLQKKMKSVMDMTPAQYILSLRLKKAEEYLKDRNLSIEEISQKTGFTSHSYFTSCFKRHYGCSPFQYRDKK